jgi:AcrR family transcriptional regulator
VDLSGISANNWGMPRSKAATKPTAPPAFVRGEPVVRAVLTATIEELATVGYEALCIEDVARRAGVNKTTVYRRWPAKADLVFAALRSPLGDDVQPPNSGSLRDDLLIMARHMAKTVSSPIGRGLMRILESEDKPKELESIGEALRSEFDAMPRRIVHAALERGEIAPSCDGEVLIGALVATIHHRIFALRRPVDEAFLHRLVTMLLDGVLMAKARKVRGIRPK